MDFHQPTPPARVHREVSSYRDAEEFPWDKYGELLKWFLPMQVTREDLVEYWRSNANLLDWAKKVRPEVYEQIRTAFAVRKQQIEDTNK